MSTTRRTLVAAVLLAGASLAQQPPEEPDRPAFRVQTSLVVVPFQFRRGSRSISELAPADLVLLEDGVPRSFTIFEPPPVRLTLDIAVMFDVTNPRADQGKTVGFWDSSALDALAGYWNETNTRRLLDGHGATIRFSIYRFDQNHLQRLCPSTSDPKVLRDALHLLAGPLAAGQAVDIPLPAGLKARPSERQNEWPDQPWSLAGAFSVLQDSSGDKPAAPRAVVIFSTGAEGSSVMPEDLADHAVTAGVPVYPVALIPAAFSMVLPYDGYQYDFSIPPRDGYKGQRRSMWGPAGPYSPLWKPADPHNPFPGSPPPAPYINYPFEIIGDVTGGLHFEAVNHSPRAGENGDYFVADGKNPPVVSMTGPETDDILERVKRHAISRFSSSYTIGFAPSPSGAPREHRLEVKLTPKSGGKVIDGKRSANY